MNRKFFVGGNWKCNGNLKSISELCKSLKDSNFDTKAVDVVIAPTAIHISHTKNEINDSNIQLSVQNISATGPGAYTGEISAEMVKDLGINWTILGHSERRQLYKETDQDLAKKVSLAEKADLKIIFCIGELQNQREAGLTLDICSSQLNAIIPVVKNWNNIVIAYEPIWAIGTGVVATVDQAQDTMKEIREYLSKTLKGDIAETQIRILYGGSVTPKNCESLMVCPDIDGFLVGGASLKPEFAHIFLAASKQFSASCK